MKSRAPSAVRDERVEYVASNLLGHTAVLTRLLIRQVRPDVSRTEAGVLRTLTDAPRRITELAELEGLAQPTMTVLVQRLEQRGWVTRGRQPDDGRVVVVSISDAGTAALEDYRARAAAVMRGHLEAMSDEQLAALKDATEALASLVDALQGRGAT